MSGVISRHTPYDMRLFEKKETLPVVETGGPDQRCHNLNSENFNERSLMVSSVNESRGQRCQSPLPRGNV